MSIFNAKMGQLFKSTFQTYAKLCYTLWLRGIKSDTKQSYTKTVLLPQTNFPARLSGKKRVEMDSYLIEKCSFLELYNWQRKNLKGPDFILHDGPPYANGEPHMGHAINKVLKDITLRNKIITGRRVHYVPGWDCHGLPIEQKVLSNIKDVNPLEIRQKARKYVSEAITKQREAFISWGVMADWNESGCYFTNHASYVKNQLQQFINLYDKGLVFRAFKPVHWSPSSRTALAESELEYNESHKSKSVIIRMQLDTSTLSSKLKNLENKPLYALIWTTTPWSLIANQAIAFSNNIVYCIVEDNSKNLYILAQECLTNIEQKLGPLKLITTIKGQELGEAKYFHPITKERLPFLPGQHVTTNVGTGLVHTAPAHGPEDFLIAIENNIPVSSLVDDDGCFIRETGDEFAGLDVLTDGTNKILHHIGEDVLHTDTITHSYPYDWRTKKPILFQSALFVHGFAVDDKASKMSKSVGNVINPEVITKGGENLNKHPAYGVDTLRSIILSIKLFVCGKSESISFYTRYIDCKRKQK